MASTWRPRSSQFGGYIPLRGKRGRGHRTTVDVEHIEACLKHSWSVSTTGYPETRRSDGKLIRLHEFIGELTGLERPPGRYYDHINRRKFDNRSVNIRVVSPSENMINGHSGPKRMNPRVPKGVCRDIRHPGKYQAYHNPAGKRISLGRRLTFREAVKRRKSAENHGVYLCLK